METTGTTALSRLRVLEMCHADLSAKLFDSKAAETAYADTRSRIDWLSEHGQHIEAFAMSGLLRERAAGVTLATEALLGSMRRLKAVLGV